LLIRVYPIHLRHPCPFRSGGYVLSKKYKGIEATQVAKAMLQSALYNDEPIKIFESDEIQIL